MERYIRDYGVYPTRSLNGIEIMENKELEKGLSILQGIIDVAASGQDVFAPPRISNAKKEEPKVVATPGKTEATAVAAPKDGENASPAAEEEEQIFFDDEPVKTAKKSLKENKTADDRENTPAKAVPPVKTVPLAKETHNVPENVEVPQPPDNHPEISNALDKPVAGASRQYINKKTPFSKSKFCSALVIAICAAVAAVAAWKAIPCKNTLDCTGYIPAELALGKNDIALWNIVRNMKGEIGRSKLVFINGIATDSADMNLKWNVQLDFLKTGNGVMTKVKCGEKYWVVNTDRSGMIIKAYPASGTLKSLRELFQYQ